MDIQLTYLLELSGSRTFAYNTSTSPGSSFIYSIPSRRIFTQLSSRYWLL